MFNIGFYVFDAGWSRFLVKAVVGKTVIYQPSRPPKEQNLKQSLIFYW